MPDAKAMLPLVCHHFRRIINFSNYYIIITFHRMRRNLRKERDEHAIIDFSYAIFNAILVFCSITFKKMSAD